MKNDRSGLVVCPDCCGSLRGDDEEIASVSTSLVCGGCGRRYPVVQGIPILLPADSVFDVGSVAASDDTYFASHARQGRLLARIRRAAPSLGGDVLADATDGHFLSLVAELGSSVTGVVIGAGTKVEQYANRFPGIDWTTTDVDLTYRPDLVADALSLPFDDATVDVVLAEHVLEHVVDPRRAALEIERVLRPGGLVLAKIPFMYPWHGGYIDFFRVTPAGMFALFRSCEPLVLEQCMGPGASAAYALYVAGVERFSARRARIVAAGVLRVALAPLKRLDRAAAGNFRLLGAAAAVTYVGRRGTVEMTAPEVLDAARRFGRSGSLTSLPSASAPSADPTP